MSDEYLTYSERKYKILILQIAVLRLIRLSWYYISTVYDYRSSYIKTFDILTYSMKIVYCTIELPSWCFCN